MNNGHFGMPGVGALNSTYDTDILWGGDESRIQVLRSSAVFTSAMADAANTPTSVIRKGMLLGKITSSGKVKEWDSASTDGSQTLIGALGVELHMIDSFAVAADKNAPYFVVAPLRANSLRIKGAALVGHADEYLARRQLHLNGCRLDDDPQGFLAGITPRISTKATDYTVVAADNGTTFHAITANATFTLPAIQAGLQFEFLRVSDHNLVITSAAGDDLIVGNDASADSITYSTASNKVGARVKVECAYVNGTLKWIPSIIPAPFSTGAFLTQTLAT